MTSTTVDSHETGSGIDLDAKITNDLNRLRTTFRSGVTRSVDWRIAQIDGLIRFAKDHTDSLLEAMAADLGRPALEGWTADISTSINGAEHVKSKVRKWAKPRRTKLPLVTQPAKAKVMAEPLGLSLIIAPWNYPVNLVLEPLVASFAAGNVVAVKPSEVSPNTTGVIARELPKYVDPRALEIFEGDAAVSTALLKQQFDHIFFTGSTHVGRIVMRAAAEHLTPVVLELGGKSPVIVADDADISVAANRIAWGKTFNAGQTCIAPDYVLVTEARRDELIDAVTEAWRSFFGDDIAQSPDFGRIVNAHHHQRLTSLIDSGVSVLGGEHDVDDLYLSPTIVIDPPVDSPIMTNEIFGPILPFITVKNVSEAIDFVNERPKPLALYVFANSSETIDAVLNQTSSGGVCVNHTLLHFVPPDLPFGGVGPSGMGRYHGKAGFDAFSNMKGVLSKPITGENTLTYPPYTNAKQKLIRTVT